MRRGPRARRKAGDVLAKPSSRACLAAAAAIALAVVLLRFLTPYDLQETDQGKQAQYALDAWQNGNWLAPGCVGVSASKPPFYTWLAVLVSRCAGGMDETTIRVPTALAAVGLVLVTYEIGRRLASPTVGLAAAAMTATSHHFVLLCGVVRTDGLLAFLVAAQILVHVRSLEPGASRAMSAAAAAAIATVACLTKGPAGLIASAAVAVHLVATGRGRRALIDAAIPAAVATAVFAAWFVAAGATRSDVSEAMFDNELARHTLREGLPNPAYYVIHTPLRLAPWTPLLFVGVWVAARALCRRAETAVPPLVAVAASWTAVTFAAFSFFPHQRPDLIYPAEPALALMVGALAERTFPAWAPRLAAVALGATAVLIACGVSDVLLPDAVATETALAAAAVCAAAAATAWIVGRRHATAATFAALTLAGLAGAVIDTLGDAPRASRLSYRPFADLARRTAAARGADIVVVGIEHPAPLFDLGLARPPVPAQSLAGRTAPFVVVTTPRARSKVQEAIGPCDVLARHVTDTASRTSLLLLAPR